MLRSRRPTNSRGRAILWTALALLAWAAPRASAEGAAAPEGTGAAARSDSVPEGTGAAARSDSAPVGLPRRIAEVDALLAGAHFHTALALARSTLGRLPAAPASPEEGRQRARLELMSATAEVALGQREAARLSLARAARADPSLVFDERELSPKVLELAPQAWRRAGAPEDLP